MEVRTACNRDCPDACALLVRVEDGRATRLRGDPDDPVTRGFLCERTSRFLDRQYADDRLTKPLLRKGGALEPVGWDEALDAAAARLTAIRDEDGGAAILHYRSGGSLGMFKALADHLFARFGPVTVKRGDICSGAGEAAQEHDFGVAESSDLFDLLNSGTIVLWGKNPHTSGVHLLPVLRDAKARGATLVGIDPVRTRAAELCDLFVRPRPGADAALAFALVAGLDERGALDADASGYCDHVDDFLALARARDLDGWARAADVAPDDARRLVDLFAERRPVNVQIGWGMGRRRNGSTTVRVIDALCAVSGNLGVPGGGASHYFGRRTAFDADFAADDPPPPRTLAEARLGDEILAAADPPVRAIWVTAGNPVSMLPDSARVRAAFERSDFTVVVDTHPTDTTALAHLVLPTLTLLEDSDLLGAYGNHWLRSSEPAIAPPDGPRHELEILQGLAARLGLAPVLAGSVEDWKRRMTRSLERAGAGLDALRAGPVRNPFAAEVLFADRRFPTTTGRANLVTRAPDPPPARDPGYPLTLLAVSTPKAQSSQWSVPVDGPAEVRVHPSVANGLGDGDVATLQSRRGALTVRVRLDDAVRPDVALMAKGGMLRDGRCANLLVAAVETDDGGGAAYYDEPVRLASA